MDWHELERIAVRELQEEEKRKKIEEIKGKLKKRKELSWVQKFFPYRIKIYRVDQQ